MLKNSLIILSVSLLVCNCNPRKAGNPNKKIARDTTINSTNAYSKLVLDSLALEKFLTSEISDDQIAENLRNFYNGRNYQFAWINEDGITEQGEAFWNMLEMNPDTLSEINRDSNALLKAMELLLERDSVSLTMEQLRTTELELTSYFFKYLKNSFLGKVSPEEMQWHIPRRKINEQSLIDSFLTGKVHWGQFHPSFYKLQIKLMEYALIASEGGWPHIELSKKSIKPGEKNAVIVEVKKRLIKSGDFLSKDTSNIYDSVLRESILKMQLTYGLNESGIIDGLLIKQLNVPVKDRIAQMKINLERMRWLPELGPNHIIANIPEYKLHILENGKEVLNMDIVVGKAASRTVIFSDHLQYVVFSPYWNIPASIVKNEIIPAIKRNPNYLDKNNMEIVEQHSVIPKIRQKPGAGNALGKVKFIFPNRFNIYFHDTPAKTLFKRDKRAFSHGCIRLQKPFELANYLLKSNEDWTAEKIQSAMNMKKETWVKLSKAVPVYIVYFTSWVDSNGLLHFREDIYGHDKRMEEHLFAELPAK